MAEGQGSHGWLWRLRFAQARAELAQARGDHEQVLRWADEALARSRRHGRIKYEVAALQVRAQALAALGSRRAALADLGAAVEKARGSGDPAMFVRAGAVLLATDGTDALLAELRSVVERIAGGLPDMEMRRRFQETAPARLIARLATT